MIRKFEVNLIFIFIFITIIIEMIDKKSSNKILKSLKKRFLNFIIFSENEWYIALMKIVYIFKNKI